MTEDKKSSRVYFLGFEQGYQKARAEMLEKMFFANRKAIEFCSDCKDLKRTLCKKHTILDIYLRDRSGEIKSLFDSPQKNATGNLEAHAVQEIASLNTLKEQTADANSQDSSLSGKNAVKRNQHPDANSQVTAKSHEDVSPDANVQSDTKQSKQLNNQCICECGHAKSYHSDGQHTRNCQCRNFKERKGCGKYFNLFQENKKYSLFCGNTFDGQIMLCDKCRGKI